MNDQTQSKSVVFWFQTIPYWTVGWGGRDLHYSRSQHQPCFSSNPHDIFLAQSISLHQSLELNFLTDPHNDNGFRPFIHLHFEQQRDVDDNHFSSFRPLFQNLPKRYRLICMEPSAYRAWKRQVQDLIAKKGVVESFTYLLRSWRLEWEEKTIWPSFGRSTSLLGRRISSPKAATTLFHPPLPFFNTFKETKVMKNREKKVCYECEWIFSLVS